MKNPTFIFERRLSASGFKMVVGVDEVGCGSLAGPVVAGAVVLQTSFNFAGLRDSKLLTAKARERLSEEIKSRARAFAIGEASVEEINELGLRPATFLAMRRALEKISDVDFVLVDAWKIPGIPFEQQGVIHGDRLIKSIAAASIIAKVYRDNLMKESSKDFPRYGFEKHKGYGTAFHLTAIEKYGPCVIHRTGWKIFKTACLD